MKAVLSLTFVQLLALFPQKKQKQNKTEKPFGSSLVFMLLDSFRLLSDSKDQPQGKVPSPPHSASTPDCSVVGNRSSGAEGTLSVGGRKTKQIQLDKTIFL